MNLRLTIRNKIFLATLFTLLISYAILIQTTVTSINASLEENLGKELSENLRYAKEQYMARGEQMKYALLIPASAQPVKERIEKKDHSWLQDAARRWRGSLPLSEFILFVDRNLEVMAGDGPSVPADVRELAPLLEKAFRENNPVSSTELVSERFLCSAGLTAFCNPGSHDAGQGVMVVTVVVPLLTESGRPLAAIVAGDVIDRDVMLSARTRQIFGKQVQVAITRGTRLPPSSLNRAFPYPADIPPSIIQRLERGIPFVGESNIGGKAYKIAFDPITNSRGDYVGSLYVALSREDYQGILKESLNNIFASAITGIILTFFIAYHVARRLTMPLNQLAEGVRMIESGDLRQRVNVTTSDEVGELGKAFNRMAHSLQERDRTIRNRAREQAELNRRLQEMNELLEKRVNERTAALQEEMGRLEAILTGMAEGIAVTDREGKIILFNPAAQRIFQVVPHRVLGRSMEEVCSQVGFCELVDYVRIMRENVDSTPRHDVEISTVAKKLKVNLSPYTDVGGAVAGVVISIRDVTAEEEVDRAKSEFISTVSHELKTPLTSIKGSLQFIHDRGKGLGEVEGELIAVCLRNTDRLIRLVNDILDMARIESGRLDFSLAPQRVQTLISQSIEEMAGFAMEHGITVENRCDDDLPPIYGDRDRLVQVLTNLLSNAIKFSPRGERVVVTAERDANYVAISVVDRGREIQWSDRGKLFRKFQQLDNSDRQRHGGTGLGLAICKEIVERHHGRIFYSEGVNGGNVFTFTVPLCEENP